MHEVQKLHLRRKLSRGRLRNRGREPPRSGLSGGTGLAHGTGGATPVIRPDATCMDDTTDLPSDSLIRRIVGEASQPRELAEISARALRDVAATAQRIEKAKRTLWALTSAANPEKGRIRAMTAEIRDLEEEQQERFMRAVAEAAERLVQRREDPIVPEFSATIRGE